MERRQQHCARLRCGAVVIYSTNRTEDDSMKANNSRKLQKWKMANKSVFVRDTKKVTSRFYRKTQSDKS